jgi:hypothetical protein
MAKGTGPKSTDSCDPSVALIVGALAAEASKYGVTPAGRELDFALQAVRLVRAVNRIQDMADADPELVNEPNIGVAIDRLRANVKAEAEAIKNAAETPVEPPADQKTDDKK